MTFAVLRHADCEGLGLWEEFCREGGVALEVVELHRGASPRPPDQFQAVISLGGPINGYAEGACPFLMTEEVFIRHVLAEGIPFLGMSLGAQLLATAVGGRVTPNGVREIGSHPVTLNEIGRRDSLFAGLPESFTVFRWHEDTFHAPPGTVQLASSQACPNQAVRIGGLCYALQFHLEATPSMVQEWVHEYGHDLGELGALVDPERLLEKAPARCEALRSVSR